MTKLVFILRGDCGPELDISNTHRQTKAKKSVQSL